RASVAKGAARARATAQGQTPRRCTGARNIPGSDPAALHRAASVEEGREPLAVGARERMVVAELAEELDHRRARLVPALRLGGAGEQELEGPLVVAGAERLGELVVAVQRLDERRLRQLVEEGVDGCAGTRAHELGDDAAVPERLHRRDPRDPVLPREGLVRVDVD